MNELQEQMDNLTNNDEARYFYHCTSANGDKIIEDGLIVANPLWEQSFLEFTHEEISNIETLLDDNKSTNIKDNNTMIIAGIYKDSMESFIRKLRPDESAFIDFEGVGSPDYIVDSKHIIGYINLETQELIINDYAILCSDNLYLN